MKQTLFRKETTGDEPFIGVIVTPYDPEILSDHSQIQYLHISKEWDELHSFRKVIKLGVCVCVLRQLTFCLYFRCTLCMS